MPHDVLIALIDSLPKPGAKFPLEARASWLRAFAGAADYLYGPAQLEIIAINPADFNACARLGCGKPVDWKTRGTSKYCSNYCQAARFSPPGCAPAHVPPAAPYPDLGDIQIGPSPASPWNSFLLDDGGPIASREHDPVPVETMVVAPEEFDRVVDAMTAPAQPSPGAIQGAALLRTLETPAEPAAYPDLGDVETEEGPTPALLAGAEIVRALKPSNLGVTPGRHSGEERTEPGTVRTSLERPCEQGVTARRDGQPRQKVSSPEELAEARDIVSRVVILPEPEPHKIGRLPPPPKTPSTLMVQIRPRERGALANKKSVIKIADPVVKTAEKSETVASAPDAPDTQRISRETLAFVRDEIAPVLHPLGNKVHQNREGTGFMLNGEPTTMAELLKETNRVLADLGDDPITPPS